MSNNLKIHFASRETYENVGVLVSSNAAADYDKVKNLISCLNNIKSIFRRTGINVPIDFLVKCLIIVSGLEEREHVENVYHKENVDRWKAFYVKQVDAIVFDINKFKNKEALIDTFVHELGHAIHTKFVAKSGYDYSNTISEYFIDAIKKLSELKNNIMSVDEDLKQDFKEEAEDVFFDFLDFLDESTPSEDGTSDKGYSYLSSQINDAYNDEKKLTHLATVDAMISSIMNYMPSEYGMTDSYEFFAECFRQFILEPDSLSWSNRNMIINTFQMSSAAGKEVMKAHRLIKDYIKLIVS
jgi:hypothetical protein